MREWIAEESRVHWQAGKREEDSGRRTGFFGGSGAGLSGDLGRLDGLLGDDFVADHWGDDEEEEERERKEVNSVWTSSSFGRRWWGGWAGGCSESSYLVCILKLEECMLAFRRVGS